ncbi:hypothetical protein AA13595_2322 [Gluconacetobacter johannae DSM 13595]|uniref:Uncharacterized protein n=1 Tax=Gluconacetobacter johannae TaxID=112140 RepID=A0A7W4P2C0_9PROT|nr:hypothetical protein [Gluconacetobacter johannae]MBB2174614.1 hypothetical protein [Gluconacetobacter johannae]GBQ88122.1 hypothetical protein AA13595_2322 [Gluconacetobacter johannae DSM 13595]
MSMSSRSGIHLVAIWPLVLLALLARLSFGSMVAPSAVFDDPVKQLAKFSILCDAPAPLSHPDGKHHHSLDDQDGSFLLTDALELLPLAVTAFLFASLCMNGVPRSWVFPLARGPPFRERSSLCPQGPPA